MRGINKTLHFVFALVLTCGTARAAEWQLSSTSNDLSHEEYIDLSSIEIAGIFRHGTTKTVYQTHAQKGNGKDAHKWWAYTLTADTYNCSDQTFRTDEAEIVFDDGTTRKLDDAHMPTPWVPVQRGSGTGLEHRMRLICSWQRRIST